MSGDIDRLLNSKTLQELSSLDTQVSKKLRSDEPIDIEYWEQLLGSIGVYKARAELDQVYKSIIDSRLIDLREQQVTEATTVKERLALLVFNFAEFSKDSCRSSELVELASVHPVEHSFALEPEPFLKLRPDDKGHEVVEESAFLDKVVSIMSPWTGPSFNILVGSRKGQDSQAEIYSSPTTPSRKKDSFFWNKAAKDFCPGSIATPSRNK